MKKSELTLVVGDKNCSAWSIPPWLALKQSGMKFNEQSIPLYTKDTRAQISKRHAPARQVPILLHGDLSIWDSLSICEYVAEIAPKKNLWPKNAAQRAIARSYVAEMHSGFEALRIQLPLDICLQMKRRYFAANIVADVERILSLWKNALKNSDGPYLFGEFGLVDAFYAPIVFRIHSYGVQLNEPECVQYVKRVLGHKHIKSLIAEASSEPVKIPNFSV